MVEPGDVVLGILRPCKFGDQLGNLRWLVMVVIPGAIAGIPLVRGGSHGGFGACGTIGSLYSCGRQLRCIERHGSKCV